jgi:hypothetical protein
MAARWGTLSRLVRSIHFKGSAGANMINIGVELSDS